MLTSEKDSLLLSQLKHTTKESTTMKLLRKLKNVYLNLEVGAYRLLCNKPRNHIAPEVEARVERARAELDVLLNHLPQPHEIDELIYSLEGKRA